jgi:hypothetical protein
MKSRSVEISQLNALNYILLYFSFTKKNKEVYNSVHLVG